MQSRPHTVGFASLRSPIEQQQSSSRQQGGIMSISDLPNLPGIRPNVGATNPKLYREFVLSRQGGSRPATNAANGGAVVGSSSDGAGDFHHRYNAFAPQTPVDESNSLLNYFENAEKLRDYTKAISAYPQDGAAYNDVNGRYSLRSQQADRVGKVKALPYSSLDHAPAFVKNSAHSCTFTAYFLEDAPENLLETTRSRLVEITFHLEDNTLEIKEPRVENSGLSQGKLLRRHQVPKPGPGRQGRVTPGPLATGALQLSPVFTIDDAYAGAELDIYSRIYTVLDCDASTKRYLESIGRPFGMSLNSAPKYWDPKLRPGNLRHKKKNHKTVKNLGFYEYDVKVLRFFGVWDGGEELFGDEQHVRIHYTLADNKIEVLPIHQRNSGRDKLSKLLKKTTILKKGDAGVEYFPSSYSRVTTAAGLDRPGTQSQTNAHGASMSGSQMVYLPDRPYHWTDLRIGEMISVASLFILVTDADEYTREFYASKNRPLGQKLSMPAPVYPTLTTYIPPYNPLFGSEEDSLNTCKGSLAGGSKVQKDGAKAQMFQGMILRFEATLCDPKPADVTRKFIVQVHLEDDTVQIREPPQRNTGHKGGIFLARIDVMMDAPDGTTRKFVPQDIVIGHTLKIRSHRFQIHGCDEYTYRFMEENCKQFPNSDIRVALEGVRRRQEVVTRLIVTTPGLANKVVSFEEVDELMRRAGLQMNKQQIMTLLRSLDPQRLGSVKMTQVLKMLMK